jgi:hypothetical protein
MATKTDDPGPVQRTVNENDLVPAEWCDGKQGVTVDYWGQRQFDSGLKTGIRQGLEEAADWLMQQAVIAFQNKDDDRAKEFRKLSEGVKAMEEKT